MRRLEARDVLLTPTDKTYKVYVRNAGGLMFRQCFKQNDGTWTNRDVNETKFYFQHLDGDQKLRFIAMMNERTLRIDIPGHFYVMPYFIRIGD